MFHVKHVGVVAGGRCGFFLIESLVALVLLTTFMAALMGPWYLVALGHGLEHSKATRIAYGAIARFQAGLPVRSFLLPDDIAVSSDVRPSEAGHILRVAVSLPSGVASSMERFIAPHSSADFFQ